MLVTKNGFSTGTSKPLLLITLHILMHDCVSDIKPAIKMQEPDHQGALSSDQMARLVKEPHSDPLDYAFGILYNFITQTTEDVMTELVKVLYSQPCIKSHGGKQTIHSYCKFRLKWTEEKIRTVFGTSPHLMQNLQTQKNIDTDFAYKVIIEFCGTAVQLLNKDIQDYIYQLPYYKYRVCRKYGSIVDDLKIVAKQFSQTILAIHTHMLMVYENCEKHFTENKFFVSGAEEAIWNKLDISDQASLSEDDFKRFRDDVSVQRLIKVQRSLCKYYSRLDISNPVLFQDKCWYENYKSGEIQNSLAKDFFIPLKRRERGVKVHLKELLQDTNPLGDVEEMVVTGLIVVGESGSGKTTLCYHLVYDWYKKLNIVTMLGSFDLVFFFECCKVRNMQLEDAVKQQMLETSLGDVDLKAFLKDLNVLFIVDGFDEGSVKDAPIMNEIWTQYSNKRILITTAPQSLAEVEGRMLNFNVRFTTVTICELDDKTRVDLLKTGFFKKVKDISAASSICDELIATHHQGDWRVVDHLGLPITAAMCMAKWASSEVPNFKCATEFLLSLFALDDKSTVQTGLTSEFTDVLQAQLPSLIGNLAWQLLIQNRRTILSDTHNKLTADVELSSWLLHLKVDPSEVLMSVFTCTFDHSTSPPGRHYSFVSRQQQVFFAARYLAESIQTQKMKVPDLHTHIDRLKDHPQLLTFLIGNLVLQNADRMIVQEVINFISELDFANKDFKYWWHFYEESCGHEEVSLFLASKLPMLWELDELTVVPAFRLLTCVPVQLISINIDIPNNVDPFDIPHFLPIMEKLPCSLRDRHNAKNPIQVELHFWNHVEFGKSSKPSDRFLNALQDWGTLTNFTGELGMDGWKVPDRRCNIRNMRVRLRSVEAAKNLSIITNRVPRICKKVRISVDFPEGCALDNLPRIKLGSTEISFQDINEQNQQWIMNIIHRIADRE